MIQGNLVGTTPNGAAALGNSIGISVGSTSPGVTTLGVQVGGIASAGQTPFNVVSGNAKSGIEIVSGQQHLIRGNLIGLAALPLATIPNGGAGIRVTGGSLIDIGTADAGSGNSVVGNLGAGVLVSGPATDSAPQGVFIVRNSIYNNGGLPIDLAVNGAPGVTPNDAHDADSGPNQLQNAPEWTQVVYESTQTRLRGKLQAAAGTAYRVDLYTAPACDASGHGGGSSYLGVTGIVTDSAGTANFELVVPSLLESGVATATASRAVDLATSEFSGCLVLGDMLFADGFESG